MKFKTLAAAPLDNPTFSIFSPFIKVLNNSILNELIPEVKYKFPVEVESPLYSIEELDCDWSKVKEIALLSNKFTAICVVADVLSYETLKVLPALTQFIYRSKHPI